MCALAFWGKCEEVYTLKELAAETAVRAICNLKMGGTNPKIIRELMKEENKEFRHCNILHAKV